MNYNNWIEYYGEHRHNFKWFVQHYFKPELWIGMESLYERAKTEQEMCFRLNSYMNDIWFALPDDRFNIIESPTGWNEFLHLLENPPSYQ